MKKLSLILVTYLLITTHISHARQLSFKKEDIGDGYQFSYRWLDINEQQQALSFTLPKKGLFSPFRQFRAYKPEFAVKYVQKKIRQNLKQSPLQNATISFGKDMGEVRISSQDKKAVQEATLRIRQEENSFLNEYLASQYYHQFTDHNQNAGIKPDHVRIAKASATVLAPTKSIILDTVNKKNIRMVTDYVLGFVQNIPYSPLESRLTSSGAGFNVPTKVLWENQGDCDSKMTLTVAMLRALMPRIKMAMIYIDQHAFIGLSILPNPGDATMTHQGRTFVLADPTGPRLLPLGKLSFDAEQAIYANHFTAEIFD